MSLTSLQSNVEKFGLKSSKNEKSDSRVKDSAKSTDSDKSVESDMNNKLDEKLKKLKEETKKLESEKDEQLVSIETELVSIETDIPKDSDSFNLSNLPDVVQRPSDSLEMKMNREMDKVKDEKEKVIKEDKLNIDILSEFENMKKKVPVKDSGKTGSMSSLTSLGLDHSGSGHVTNKVKSVSLSGSPLHQSREGSESPGAGKQLQKVSSSLADLQDPSTFTIGTSPKGRRKITKADFTSGETTLDKTEDDGSDPLSTLDPLWSLK